MSVSSCIDVIKTNDSKLILVAIIFIKCITKIDEIRIGNKDLVFSVERLRENRTYLTVRL